MRRHIMLGLACLCTACAGHVENHPVMIGLEINPVDQALWQNHIQEANNSLPNYQVYQIENKQNSRVLDHIEKIDGKSQVCLAPRTIYTPEGEINGFIPLTCSQLDENNPVKSLIQTIQDAENKIIRPTKSMTDADFRQAVLAMSTPDNPVCFAVFPDLFASYIGDISISLIESYLIKCAQRIDGDGGIVPTRTIAQWMTEDAALLSTNTSFIQHAFDMAAADRSYEGMSYGSALEAHVEMLSRKQIQSEITSLASLDMSDKAKNDFVSRQNIERLLYSMSIAESMTGDRMETMIKAMAPDKDEKKPFQQLRQIIQIRACQMAVIVPETKPSLASACMPWLKYSLNNQDEFESALMLIAHGMDNATQGEAPVATDVLEWLISFSTENSKIDESRKVFLKRIPMESLNNANYTGNVGFSHAKSP